MTTIIKKINAPLFKIYDNDYKEDSNDHHYFIMLSFVTLMMINTATLYVLQYSFNLFTNQEFNLTIL